MKKAIVVLVVCAVLGGMSTGWAKGQPPNFISCHNDRGTVTLHYTASSFAGSPQFRLTIDGEQLFPPMFRPILPEEEQLWIDTDTTVFGTLVHAVDATHTLVDAPALV